MPNMLKVLYLSNFVYVILNPSKQFFFWLSERCLFVFLNSKRFVKTLLSTGFGFLSQTFIFRYNDIFVHSMKSSYIASFFNIIVSFMDLINSPYKITLKWFIFKNKYIMERGPMTQLCFLNTQVMRQIKKMQNVIHYLK